MTDLTAYDFQDNFYWVTKSSKKINPSDNQNFAIQVNNKYYKTYYLFNFGAVRINRNGTCSTKGLS